MPYDHKSIDAVSGAAPHVPASPAPGKVTPTSRLEPRKTGVDIVDDGTACERPGAADASCFLTSEKRTRLLQVIGDRAGIVGANSRDAINDTRTDTLLEKEETWGPILEMLYYAPTGYVIGVVAGVMKASTNPRVVAATDHVVAGLTNLSRGGRKVAQGDAVASGKHQQASKARFIELVRDLIPLWQANVVEFATSTLDDDGLVGLKDGLDPAVFTVSYFKERLVDMLARFERDQIDQVGVKDVIGYYHGELMYVGRGRKRRLIMLESHGLHHLAATGDSTKPRDLVEKAGRDGKPIVVDKDLEPMALALYVERTGREPFEMDPEDAIAAGGALARIGNDLLVEMLTLGSAP